METQEIILTSHRIFVFQADYLKGNHFILGKNYFLFSFYKKMHLHSSYFLSRKAYILLFIYIHFLHPYDFSPQSLGEKKPNLFYECVCVSGQCFGYLLEFLCFKDMIRFCSPKGQRKSFSFPLGILG